MDPSALGRYLRESREAKELTLEDAVTALRIRRPILEAFEQGDFSLVETPVQIRGLLRNYARFLNLDEERVLQYYEAAISPKRRSRFSLRRRREPKLAAPLRITDTPPSLPAVSMPESRPRRGRIKRDSHLLRNVAMITVSIAAVAVVVFVIYSMVVQAPQTVAATSVPTIQSFGDSTATATFFPTSTPLAPENTLDFAAQGFVGLAIRMEMTQRSWVRIVADDIEQVASILEPNEVVEFDANNTVQITIGNAAAVRLTVNNQEQAPFGSRGQEAIVSISTSGISITLTGEVSPTSPNTVLPTNTTVPSQIPSTATATAVQVNTIGQADVTTVQVTIPSLPDLPTPTSIFDDPVSPEPEIASITPIFETSSSDTQTTSGDTASADTSIAETAVSTATGVVLPLRATAANATPTKEN
ncbi:MAG: helix-turn-helix domain-containing protein [Anaerolineae bacterium]|nr:helix-turn-helix domain-containing protein [Anaerolineae bacterium]